MIQGHRNPFGKALRDYSIAELDFVLEMASLDEPERYSFTRSGKQAGVKEAPAAMATWLNVLTGALRDRYLERIGVARGIRSVLDWKAKQTGGLKLGFSRKVPPADSGG